jgi:hypothetical protein
LHCQKGWSAVLKTNKGNADLDRYGEEKDNESGGKEREKEAASAGKDKKQT